MSDSVARMLQTTIALITMCILGVSGYVDEVRPYRGSLAVETTFNMGWAIGGFIFVGSLDYPEWTSHEYGHVRQEQMLGIFYIPMIAIPSMFSVIINDHKTHAGSEVEKWATALGGE